MNSLKTLVRFILVSIACMTICFAGMIAGVVAHESIHIADLHSKGMQANDVCYYGYYFNHQLNRSTLGGWVAFDSGEVISEQLPTVIQSLITIAGFCLAYYIININIKEVQ